jgi:hypothetical protein
MLLMTTSKKISEKRIEKRWSVDKPGEIFFGTPRNDRRCQVLDWSARGAKLKFPKGFTCPEEIFIKISFGKSIWASSVARVAWTHGGCVGVNFGEELEFNVEKTPKDGN